MNLHDDKPYDDQPEDELDRELRAAHALLEQGHEQQRRALMSALESAGPEMGSAKEFAPGTSSGTPPGHSGLKHVLYTFKTHRRLIMKTSLGLAACIAFAVAVGWMLFSPGTESRAMAAEDVIAELENVTAVHYRYEYVVYDADGQVLSRWDRREIWLADHGKKTRQEIFDRQGERAGVRVMTPIGEHGFQDIGTVNTSKQAIRQITTYHSTAYSIPPRPAGFFGQEIDVLDQVLEMIDHAQNVGQERLHGEDTAVFEIAIDDMLALQDMSEAQEMYGWTEKIDDQLPPVRIWVSQQTHLPLQMEVPEDPRHAPNDVPEDGRYALSVRFLDWNERVDDEIFTVEITEDWDFTEIHTVCIGDQAHWPAPEDGPDDSVTQNIRRARMVFSYPRGLALKSGVTFRLIDSERGVLATEEDVMGVPWLTEGAGHWTDSQGVRETFEGRDVLLILTPEARGRLAAALDQGPVSEDTVQWTFELGSDLNGTWSVLTVGGGLEGMFDELTPLHLDIGDLTIDEFIETYLEAHPEGPAEGE